MSTAITAPSRALFTGSIDDAAVFPPGNYSLAEAISRRGARCADSHSDLVGPLLLPPQLIEDALLHPSPLTLVVVGRPDVPLITVLEAGRAVTSAAAHSLAGVEIGYRSEWRTTLDLGVPLAVEVPPVGHEDALDDLARAGLDQVRAKLRTGSTPTSPVPSPVHLARFFSGAIARGLSVKLTGGLHRAASHHVAGPGGGEDQFGFLNVLLATDALLRGESEEAAVELLTRRDRTAVAASVAELSEARVALVRNTFHSFGCCDVLDPIRDLSDLRLIEERA